MSMVTKGDTLNLRIKPDEHNLIDQAAKSLGKTAPIETLLDRTVLTVSPEAYAEFLARLDAPPQPNDRLRRTMQTPAPWERP